MGKEEALITPSPKPPSSGGDQEAVVGKEAALITPYPKPHRSGGDQEAKVGKEAALIITPYPKPHSSGGDQEAKELDGLQSMISSLPFEAMGQEATLITPFPKPHSHSSGGDEEAKELEDLQSMISSLPFEEGLVPSRLRNYKGFWYADHHLEGNLAFCSLFKARTTDIFLTSAPKCGTTWLKALTFAVVTRRDYPLDRHPLLSESPQECIPLMEGIFLSGNYRDKLDTLPSPRLISTHMPYSLLPDSVKTSGCRILYVCRDPKDAFVSGCYFFRALAQSRGVADELLPLAAAFDKFCQGVSADGPIWDHNLEYWRASLERPGKVSFFKYEEMAEDILKNVRRLAEFVGQPFSVEEEEAGMVEEIVKLCSFDKLSRLEANRTGALAGRVRSGAAKSSFFRKGRVGDWKNHLTAEMGRALDEVVKDKLAGSGLSFASDLD